MKLSRNKIQKIRKQQHQSVRKWKKHHKSARRTTFRQSRRQNMAGVMTKYPSIVNNVVNRTLKKYIPLSELAKIKNNYKKMRRMRRKQKMYKMTGGVGVIDNVQELPANTANTAKTDNTANPNIEYKNDTSSIVAAAVAAAIASAVSAINANKPQSNVANNPNTENVSGTQPTSAAAASNELKLGQNSVESETSNTVKEGETTSTKEQTANNVTTPNTGKKQSRILGPNVIGDITIRTDEHVCYSEKEAYRLIEFLITKGLPYYVQIDIDPVNKPTLSKNDTDIFDLRRILYGKFAKDITLVPESKRSLYFQENTVVGIANGDTLGNEYPDSIFIHTGEKGQIQKKSSDTEIKIKIIKKSSTDTPVDILYNSNRLYKLGGKDKAASIDTIDLLRKLDRNNQINTSEFRLQVAPLTEDEFKKDSEIVAAGGNNPQGKTVTDESNTYVVNLKEGCKIRSIQTLRKSLERARLSLENEKDNSKTDALNIFKMLNELLENPDFTNSDGYADFKESVFGYSYKLRGSERLFGFAQLKTIFEDNKESLPSGIKTEFLKLLKLLGHGPNGPNGDCERFNNVSRSDYELRRIQTFEEDGKIVTKTTDTLDSALNISGFAKQISKMDNAKTSDNNETKNPVDNETKNPDNTKNPDKSENRYTSPTMASSTVATALSVLLGAR
jgi:hypothetical protein